MATRYDFLEEEAHTIRITQDDGTFRDVVEGTDEFDVLLSHVSISPYVPPPTPVHVPVPSLSDWRVALIQMGRFDDVSKAVIAARDSGTVEGKIAWERFEYANEVKRSGLVRLAPTMGFTEADIDQSLKLADELSRAG